MQTHTYEFSEPFQNEMTNNKRKKILGVEKTHINIALLTCNDKKRKHRIK